MSLQPTHIESQTTVADCAALLQRIKPLALEYEDNLNLRKKNDDVGFNLFELISDHYYRETFHSGILNALLDPFGKHQEGKKYLDLFLEFVKSHGARIELTEYKNAQVVKEEDRIDILIKDDVSKRAIILENKINGASDREQQLPGYLKKVTDKRYSCDAIIYLRLNGETRPDMKKWGQHEKKDEVIAKLIVICAYDGTDDGTEKDLLKGWILKCENESKENSDARHILRQYAAIIKKLGGNIMNKPIMKEFYETIVKDDGKFKTALSLRKMMDDDLIPYRVERIIDEFKNDLKPFCNISSYENCHACFDNVIQNGLQNFGALALDIWVEPESYLFRFIDRNDDEGTNGQAQDILDRMGCLHDYNSDGGWFNFSRKFEFPSEEEDLIRHVTTFKKKLGEVLLTV